MHPHTRFQSQEPHQWHCPMEGSNPSVETQITSQQHLEGPNTRFVSTSNHDSITSQYHPERSESKSWAENSCISNPHISCYPPIPPHPRRPILSCKEILHLSSNPISVILSLFRDQDEYRSVVGGDHQKPESESSRFRCGSFSNASSWRCICDGISSCSCACGRRL